MKTENKRNYELGNYSSPKKQKTHSNPLAEQILNGGIPDSPLPLYPPMSISSCYALKNKLNWLTKQEMEKGMRSLPSNTFNERWLSLHQIMAIAPGVERDTIYIDWDKTTTFMVYQREERKFRSEAIEETLLRDYPEAKNPYFRYIEIAEWIEGNEEPRVKITYSPLGTASELSWIEKGIDIPGNKLFQIYEWMQELLRPRSIYLFDDAKLSYGKEENRKEISLRYLKVFSASAAPYNSWYEEKGYALVDSPHVVFNKKDERAVFKQSPDGYLAAKSYLRGLTLWDLSTKILTHDHAGLEKIQRLFKKYVKKPNPTVHDLVKEMTLKSKESKGKEHLHLSKIDDVFSICLDELEESKCPRALKAHQAHVLTFRLARLYVKKF